MGQGLPGPEPPASRQVDGLQQPGVGAPGTEGAPGGCHREPQEEENDPFDVNSGQGFVKSPMPMGGTWLPIDSDNSPED